MEMQGEDPPTYNESLKYSKANLNKVGPLNKEEAPAIKPSEEDFKADEDAANRGAWGSQFEFILTCVGQAVGMGNVWRFPYLCFKHGGGAFLIPYVIMLALVGLPFFFFELAFGQFASLGPLAIWKISPILKGVGVGMVAVLGILGLYYNVIIAWALYFLFSSMTSVLPWSDCNNSWNTQACLTSKESAQFKNNTWLLNKTLADRGLTDRSQFKTPSEEFYYRSMLKITDNPGEPTGEVVWQLALLLLLSWFIVFLVLLKGIKSLGKIVYFVAIFPYIMMTIMLIRGCTLPGALKGIEFYMKPDASLLGNAEAWSDAATQIFYSLCTCSGGLIAMASYNPFKNNCLRDSLIVPFVNCATSLFAGFAIFSVLGFMAEEKGVEVADVAESGPGLVFIVYPEALTQMPVAPLWSVLFFIMLITLGFSSEFSIVESVFVAVMDEFPGIFKKYKWSPIIFRGISISIYFLITIPMVTNGGFYLFNLVDTFLSGFPLLFIGLFELSAVMYVYGFKRFSDDIAMMLGKKPNIYFLACWLVITPLILMVVSIFKAIRQTPIAWEGTPYPDWAQALGWLIVAFTVVFIPGIAMFTIISKKAFSLEKLKEAAGPESSWGPALSVNKTGRYAKEKQELAMSVIAGEDNFAFTSEEGMSEKKEDVFDEKLTQTITSKL